MLGHHRAAVHPPAPPPPPPPQIQPPPLQNVTRVRPPEIRLEEGKIERNAFFSVIKMATLVNNTY